MGIPMGVKARQMESYLLPRSPIYLSGAYAYQPNLLYANVLKQNATFCQVTSDFPAYRAEIDTSLLSHETSEKVVLHIGTNLSEPTCVHWYSGTCDIFQRLLCDQDTRH